MTDLSMFPPQAILTSAEKKNSHLLTDFIRFRAASPLGSLKRVILLGAYALQAGKAREGEQCHDFMRQDNFIDRISRPSNSLQPHQDSYFHFFSSAPSPGSFGLSSSFGLSVFCTVSITSPSGQCPVWGNSHLADAGINAATLHLVGGTGADISASAFLLGGWLGHIVRFVTARCECDQIVGVICN
jgi:hypothetical protein